MFKENFLVFKRGKGPEKRMPVAGVLPPETNPRTEPFNPKKEKVSSSADVGEFLAENDMNVFKKSVDLMVTAGVSRGESERILADDTNPYSLWYMDFIQSMPANGWDVDMEGTKKERKMKFRKKGETISRYLRNADRLVQWEKIVYPNLVRLVERWGGGLKFDDFRGAMEKVINDYWNYPGVETWLGLSSNLGPGVSNKVQLAAMIELFGAAGLDASGLKAKLNEVKNGGVYGSVSKDLLDKIRNSGVGDRIKEKLKYEVKDHYVYYDENDDPITDPEKIAELEEERRISKERSEKMDQARGDVFGEDADGLKEIAKRVPDPIEMSQEEFESFKSEVLDFMDSTAGKSPVIDRWKDTVKDIFDEAEVLMASGWDKGDVQDHVKESFKEAGLMDEFNEIEDSGDFEVEAEWSMLEGQLEILFDGMATYYGSDPDSDMVP
jgi:hypothetical protein